MPMEAPEPHTCESCGEEIQESASATDGDGNYWHIDHAPDYLLSFVAPPEPIGDESTTPTLCVGYPIDGGVTLVRRYRDRAGGGTEFSPIEQLGNEQVDKLIEELEEYRDNSPAYESQ